jgi:hypothetical protein
MSDTTKPGRDTEHDDAADVHDADSERHRRAGWDEMESDPEKADLDRRDANIDLDAATVDRDRARLERKRDRE